MSSGVSRPKSRLSKPDLDPGQVLGPVAELDLATAQSRVGLVLVALEVDGSGPAHPPRFRPEESLPEPLGVGLAMAAALEAVHRRLLGLGVAAQIEVALGPGPEAVVEFLEAGHADLLDLDQKALPDDPVEAPQLAPALGRVRPRMDQPNAQHGAAATQFGAGEGGTVST